WPGRHATEDNPGLFAMAVLLETLQRTGASPQARLRLAADWTLSPPIDPPRRFGVESEPRSRADRMTASALTAYRVFHASHARHGPLLFGADEPIATGYRVWAAYPCGASWDWWVSVAEVVRDLDPGDLRRVLAET